MKRRAAIYIRVSTDAQREEGYSIEAQKEMLTAYCVSKGIGDYEYYIDGGYSGSNIERPELKRLVSDVLAGGVSMVLVYKLDRLSRSQKDTLYLIEDVLNPNGVDFVSLNESMDTSTPLGRLMLGILSAFAQLERENIKERTRMGMRERVKAGLWPGGGRVPFGYDYDAHQGILVPNADADTVRRIYQLYLEGCSTAKIARLTGLRYEKLARQILSRKSNAGYIVYNNEEYKGRHEPLVSLETYEAAMDAMAGRATGRANDSEYLLTGLVYCGKCGGRMRYQKWGKKGFKIVCYGKDKHKSPNFGFCDSAGAWAARLESAVLEDLFALSVKEGEKSGASAAENALASLKKQRDESSRKLRRLYGLYAEGSDDEALLAAINDQKRRHAAIEKEIESESERRAVSKKAAKLQKQMVTLQESWPHMTAHEQKAIMRSILEKIVISDKIEIYYKF